MAQQTILGTDTVKDALKTKVNNNDDDAYVNIAEVEAARVSTVTSESHANLDTRLESIETAQAVLTVGSACPVSLNDAAPGVLNGKLVAGEGIDFTEGNDGGDETLTILGENATDTNKGICRFANSHFGIGGTITINSGGTNDIVAEDTIQGATSGALARVISTSNDSGSWVGGDWAGTLTVSSIAGTWQTAENINNITDSNNNVATTTSALVANGTIYNVYARVDRKGIASFNTNDFTVTAGAVVVKHYNSTSSPTTTLTATQCRGNNDFTNSGAVAEVEFTLDAVTQDHKVSFFVLAAQYLKIIPPSGSKIKWLARETATDGYIRSNNLGDCITLECAAGSGYWRVSKIQGTWLVDE